MVGHEGPHLQVDLLQASDVLLAVPDHVVESLPIAVQHVEPEFESGLLLPAQAQVGPEIVQPVGDEPEFVLGNELGIDESELRERLQPVIDESSVQDLDIEVIPVVSDQDIRFRQIIPNLPTEGLVITRVVRSDRERADGRSAEFLPADAQNIRLLQNIRVVNVVFPEAPDRDDQRRGF